MLYLNFQQQSILFHPKKLLDTLPILTHFQDESKNMPLNEKFTFSISTYFYTADSIDIHVLPIIIIIIIYKIKPHHAVKPGRKATCLAKSLFCQPKTVGLLKKEPDLFYCYAILTLTIPKSEEVKPKKTEVKIK